MGLLSKRRWLLVLMLLTCILVMGAFSACGAPSSDGVSGTYYLYKNNAYDKTQYIKLSGSSWEDDDGETGTYSISGSTIVFYYEIFGENEELMSGTINDGVITVSLGGAKRVYCKEGKGDCVNNKAHTEVIDSAVAATCTSDGLTEGKHCSVCNKVLVAQVVVNAIGHKFSNYVSNGLGTKTATCERDGCTQTETIEEIVTNEELFKFEKVEGGYRVTGCVDGIIACGIPSIYNNLPVISIGQSAFSSCRSLTSITIPDSVTSIGSSAFDGCRSLTSVTIGNGVTSIGYCAFYNCSSLASITIPDSVTSIDRYAFYNCSSLTSITIGNGVTSIVSSAFEGCNNIIQTENSVSYVDKWVIDCDTSVTQVELREDTKGIASSVFSNCSSLESITIPDRVTSIGQDAFYKCSSLESITIPDSVTSIGKEAFYNCSSLTSVTIPDSVTSIGSGAFYECSSLKAVYITDIAAWCNISFGSTVANPLYFAKNLYLNNELVTDLVIPDGVTSIGNYAFDNCSSLTSITIPGSVTSIGYCAFYNCSSLTSITIPDSVTSIGDYAFEYCSSLTSVTFEGTIEQWNAIEKGSDWNYNTGKYTVHCNDGDIAK